MELIRKNFSTIQELTPPLLPSHKRIFWNRERLLTLSFPSLVILSRPPPLPCSLKQAKRVFKSRIKRNSRLLCPGNKSFRHCFALWAGKVILLFFFLTWFNYCFNWIEFENQIFSRFAFLGRKTVWNCGSHINSAKLKFN